MNLPSLYEITSNDKLLNSLGLAIAEARMVRSLIRARESSRQFGREGDDLERLTRLNREIAYLETELGEVRSKTARALD